MMAAMRSRAEAGLTLMEVLVTVALMSIALLGLAVAYPIGRAAVLQARFSTTMVALAEQRMEQAKRTPYVSLNTLAGTDSSTHAPYTINTVISVDLPVAGMTTVGVTVTSPNSPTPLMANTGPETVTLETFVSAP
jgi:prepilin-type N-terminal cleavage/methylation domain-containing protein